MGYYDWLDFRLESTDRARELGQRLIRMIDDAILQPGSRIPSERDLAQMTRLSRGAVRDALRDLEQRGLIERTPGRGTTVTHPERAELRASMLAPSGGSTVLLNEVMDLRATIEPPIAERAALRRQKMDLPEILRLLEEAEHLIEAYPLDIDALSRLDVEFHTAVSRASKNSLIGRLVGIVNEWMAPARQNHLQSPRRLRQSVVAHRVIYEAIAAGDASRAHNAMRNHILEVHENINRAY